ncbi:MAG TPA: 3-dehydroquinate synthase [Chthoniobacter sp.]|nr:3-dehydroquinate synthase [Chthoniobacter sp.]
MTSAHTVLQRIDVNWEFPVVFTHALFDPANPVLVTTLDRKSEHRRHRAMVFVDNRVAETLPQLTQQITAYFTAHPAKLELVGAPCVVPGGEAIKNDFSLVDRFMRQMLEAHLDRQAFVIIVGGGAVMDAVGLAAALVHRGLRQIRVPTTVLGQNDAGVGVKNGVNFLGGKNAIGTFAPPFAVLNDFDFLLTLPDRDWLCGVAEAFKVSIIRDREFFAELVAEAEKYPARNFEAMQTLVTRCAEIHLEHIRTNGDPFEYGRARPLDFGHWSAHKLELMSGFAISHGQAVATGVLLDSIYAEKKGWLTKEELSAIGDGFRRSGFHLWFDELNRREADGLRTIFGGLRDFQEHLGGELTVTFPRGLGARHEVHEIDLALMELALQELESFARSR